MQKWLLIVGFMVVAGGGCLWLLQSQRSDDGLGSDSASGVDDRTDTSSELLAGKPAPTLTVRSAPGLSQVSVALQGRVEVAKSGEPIEGALVLVFRSRPEEVFRRARSDKTGAYRVDGLAPGVWWILAIHAEYMPPGLLALVAAKPGNPPPEALRVDVPHDGSAPEERVIRLYAGARVRGRVIDESGAGVSDARIYPRIGDWIDEIEERVGVSLPDWEDYLPIRSDANGHFAFAFLPPIVTSVSVGAEKDGLVGKWSDPVAPGSGEEAVVRMVRAATISGHVTTPDGSPAVGVEVEVPKQWESLREWVGWVDDVSTDAEGKFTLADVPPAEVSVKADWVAPYMDGPEAIALDRLSPGEARAGVSIVIVPRYVLRARVRSPKGVALEHERFAIMTDEAKPKELDAAPSDGDGAVAFAQESRGPFRLIHRTMQGDVVVLADIMLPAGTIEVVAEATHWTQFRLRIVDEDGRLADGYRSSVHSLVGDVLRNRELFADAGHDNHPRRNGCVVFVAGGLPVSVEVRAYGEERANRAIEVFTVTIDRIPASGIVDVRLPRAGVFSGTVLDTKGLPVPGVQLTVVGRGPEQRLLAHIPIATDGSFAIPIPKTKRKARVVINAPDGYLAVRPKTFDPKMPLHHIVLHPAGVIAGKVSVPDRADVAGKDLLVVEWDGASGEGLRRSQTISVSENGDFEARRVPLDRPLTIGCDTDIAYESNIVLKASLRGVRAGERDLRVVFQSALSIRGTVRVAGGQPKVVWVSGQPHDSGDLEHTKAAADGSFELKGLGHQMYALTVTAGSVILDQRSVRSGTSVSIDVGPRSSITVRSSAAVHVRVFVSGTATLVAKAFAPAGKGVDIAGLRLDQRYDVSVASGLAGAAYRTNIGVGEVLDLTLEPAISVLGRIEGDEFAVGALELFARGENGCFQLSQFEGEYSDQVAPGRYDIVARLANGTQRVLARNVNVGPDELVLNLTLK